jgi:hypothetical protein
VPFIAQVSEEIRYILGDSHYNREPIKQVCPQTKRILVASRKGKPRKKASGREVRKTMHAIRSKTIENFNEQFKGIFDAHAQVPTKGWAATRRWALGCVLVYQLALLQRFESGQNLRVGLKSFLLAA